MGTWCVVDIFAGHICKVGDHLVNRLVEGDAIEMTELLNEVGASSTSHKLDDSLAARRRWRVLRSRRGC